MKKKWPALLPERDADLMLEEETGVRVDLCREV